MGNYLQSGASKEEIDFKTLCVTCGPSKVTNLEFKSEHFPEVRGYDNDEDDQDDKNETFLKGIKMDYVRFNEYNLCRGFIPEKELDLILNSKQIPDKCKMIKKYKYNSQFKEYLKKSIFLKQFKDLLNESQNSALIFSGVNHYERGMIFQAHSKAKFENVHPQELFQEIEKSEVEELVLILDCSNCELWKNQFIEYWNMQDGFKSIKYPQQQYSYNTLNCIMMFGGTCNNTQAFSDSYGGYFTQSLFSDNTDFKDYFKRLALVCQKNKGCFMLTGWNAVIRVCELDENMQHVGEKCSQSWACLLGQYVFTTVEQQEKFQSEEFENFWQAMLNYDGNYETIDALCDKHLSKLQQKKK